MRHTTTMLAAALLLAGLTAGCSGDSKESTVAKASDTPSASSSPSPSPTPSETEETFHFGDTVDISADSLTFSASVLAYKDTGISAAQEVLQPGQKWAAAEVKVCNTGDEPFAVSPFVWSLAYEDGARVEATHMSGGEFPRPLYPLDARVKGGDCVRGNILFEVPEEGRAERVLYSPEGLDESVEWFVSKG
jgi:hypothetical protein